MPDRDLVLRHIGSHPLKVPIREVLCSYSALDAFHRKPIFFRDHPELGLEAFLARHFCGDWGQVPDEWKARMDGNLEQGGIVITCLPLPKEAVPSGEPEPWLFIWTAADRSYTKVWLALWPDDAPEPEISPSPNNDRYLAVVHKRFGEE